MNTKKIIENLSKKFPQLPKPKLWEKYEKKRYYYNKEENSVDYTFFIDFTDKKSPKVLQKQNSEWHRDYPKKQELEEFLMQFKVRTANMVPKIGSEFYQVNVEKLGRLYGYKINISGGRMQKIGGKLAYRLRFKFGGHWNFSEYVLLSNKYIEENKLNEFIKSLWAETEDTFNTLTKITFITDIQPPPKAIADFAAAYLETEYKSNISNVLDKYKKHDPNVEITRNCRIRGWQIFNNPAISVSVKSNMAHVNTLDEFMKSVDDQQDLMDLEVIDIYLSHRGKITGITGFLKDHRDRLLKIPTRELIKKKIQKAPDTEIVVSIDGKYDYVASSLRPIITTKNARLFNINPRKLMNHFALSPEYRNKIEDEIINIFQEFTTINYNSDTTPELFKQGVDIGFKELIRFKDGTIHSSDEYVINNMQKHGIFQLSPKFQEDKTIRICLIVSTLFKAHQEFWEALKKQLQTLGFVPKLESKIMIKRVDRLHIEEQVKTINKEGIDIIVGILAEGQNRDTIYEIFKSVLFNQGILESQFVFEHTIQNFRYALANVTLGILAKTGNIPYILAEPLEFADFFVGIDISREKKSGLKGSQNYLAMARFYGKDGTFKNYEIHEDKIEGETVPKIIFEKIFAKSQFQNKRIMIHRDGLFRGSEISDLEQIGKKYNIKFQFVEVIKTNAPRLYGSENGKYGNPKRNQIFYLGEQEAILINSKITGNKTANPLRVRFLGGNCTLNEAIRSVMALRLMHFGTTKTPKLPVTISFSDRISGFARRGITPPNRSGKIPWWY